MEEPPAFSLFQICALTSRFEHLNHIIAYAYNDGRVLSQKELFEAYFLAALNGRLDVLHQLDSTQMPERVLAVIRTELHDGSYPIYRHTASQGHLQVLKHLEQRAPDDVPSMMWAGEFKYGAYINAATNGHLEVLKHLEARLPAEVIKMIEAGRYDAYRLAALSGHIDVVKHLEERAPEYARDMFVAFGPHIYQNVVSRGFIDVVNCLHQHPSFLGYAESHDGECFARHVRPFIDIQLQALQQRREAYERTNPTGVFDLEADEVALYFYCLRNLIRRNDDAMIEYIQQLLTLPRFRQALTNNDNELLRLAMRLDNYNAALALLNVDGVRELAEANRFYQAEQRVHGAWDLRQLAADRESSMRALNQAEREVADRVRHHYQAQVQAAGGVGAVFESFKATLKARYDANPAVHKRGSESITLPFEWQALQALRVEKLLSEVDYQAILKAYYRHDDHTAFRYVSKPNHWMDNDAAYANIDETRTQRWSTFEEYKVTIAYFWLAACDESTPVTQGHTFEGRVEQFIRQLALIGRAHNWDCTRTVTRADGHVIQEEYDDLAGDKPSCFSGVNRRLFQSVLGHPLFEGLTPEVLKQEICQFVRAHFGDVLQRLDAHAVKAAFERLVDLEETEDDLQLMAKLNITAAQIEAFQTALNTKYGHVFSANPYLKKAFHQDFKLTEFHRSHFEKFYGPAKLPLKQPPRPRAQGN